MLALLPQVIYTTVHNGARLQPVGIHFVNVLVIEKGKSGLSVSRVFSSLEPSRRFMPSKEISR
jgi:hypothetical protein